MILRKMAVESNPFENDAFSCYLKTEKRFLYKSFMKQLLLSIQAKHRN